MGRAACTPTIDFLENGRKLLIPRRRIFMIRREPQIMGNLVVDSKNLLCCSPRPGTKVRLSYHANQGIHQGTSRSARAAAPPT